MKRFLLPFVVAVSLAAIFAIEPARADIVAAGEVSPAMPPLWSGSSDGYVGISGRGSLMINSGTELASVIGWLGYDCLSANGSVTVSGRGSI
jgi:hypothetical protein